MRNKKYHSSTKRFAQSPQHKEDSAALLCAHVFKSVAITLGIGIGLIFIFSLLAYFMQDPNTLIRPLGLLGAAMTAFAGGIASGRLHKHSALLCGLLNGSVTMGILMLLSLFFVQHASNDPIWLSALLHIAFLLLSVLGAFVGLPRMSVKKKKKSHLR